MKTSNYHVLILKRKREPKMGGNAIKDKGFPVLRLDKEHYDLLKGEIMDVLRSFYAGTEKEGYYLPTIPFSYENKETFGDIDILLDLDGLPNHTSKDDVIRGLMNHYGVREELQSHQKQRKDLLFPDPTPVSVVVRNGDVTSIGIPVEKDNPSAGLFQVDLISSHTRYFNYNVSYFSWNDLGNLMGVIASKTNQLKHGHDGLHAMVREGDHLLGTVELTVDFDLALKFLGYDPERYHQGFESLEAIYRYASSPKWFDPEYFLDVNRSHTQRIRDRKRSTYSGFLKWCEVQKKEGYFDNKEKVTDDLWKNRIKKYFPEFLDKEKRLRDEFAKKKLVRQYFNGVIVAEHKPELQGSELGKFMAQLKTPFTSTDEFENFVLEHKEEALPLLLKQDKEKHLISTSNSNVNKKSGFKP